MSDERPRAEFNIGSQQGNISNVAGDMTVQGGQQYVVASVDDVREELAKLRRMLSAIGIDTESQRSVEDLVTEATRELNQPQPDAQRVGRPIEGLTKILKDAGALTSAGAALIDPLQRIASWLGASGRAILDMLGSV
jgi:hypothetical protein